MEESSWRGDYRKRDPVLGGKDKDIKFHFGDAGLKCLWDMYVEMCDSTVMNVPGGLTGEYAGAPDMGAIGIYEC